MSLDGVMLDMTVGKCLAGHHMLPSWPWVVEVSDSRGRESIMSVVGVCRMPPWLLWSGYVPGDVCLSMTRGLRSSDVMTGGQL